MPAVSVVVSVTDRPAAADELLRDEVARRTGLPLTDVVIGRVCPRCGSREHGRPLVLTPPGPMHLSVGRARGITVVAVGDTGPVGIDVEPAGAASFAGFDEVVLHQAERAADARGRTRTWVRKEALLKATGEGLRTDPRTIRVDAGCVALTDGATAWLRDIDVSIGDWAVAVAVLCPDAPLVSVRAAAAAAGGAASR